MSNAIRRAGSGEWVRREVDIHKCQKPPYASDVMLGDIWKCDCGTKYRVAGIEYGHQRDPLTVPRISWNMVQEHGVYAPGTK